MNIEQLRQSVRAKWLSYYEQNRTWLVRLGIWVNCEGQRRPSSSFILATLSVLEPQLTQMLPLIVDLSNNPDRIVMALGLNFNPDELLEAAARNQSRNEALTQSRSMTIDRPDTTAKQLSGRPELELSSPRKAVNLHSRMDESCRGSRFGRE